MNSYGERLGRNETKNNNNKHQTKKKEDEEEDEELNSHRQKTIMKMLQHELSYSFFSTFIQ